MQSDADNDTASCGTGDDLPMDCHSAGNNVSYHNINSLIKHPKEPAADGYFVK